MHVIWTCQKCVCHFHRVLNDPETDARTPWTVFLYYHDVSWFYLRTRSVWSTTVFSHIRLENNSISGIILNYIAASSPRNSARSWTESLEKVCEFASQIHSIVNWVLLADSKLMLWLRRHWSILTSISISSYHWSQYSNSNMTKLNMFIVTCNCENIKNSFTEYNGIVLSQF